MQHLDAERRSAILRGHTPPPLPEATAKYDEIGSKAGKNRDGHDRKRRKLAGEDDTDRDIRLAKTAAEPGNDECAAVLKLRKPTSDAPLTDHAGNINLFPLDLKEVAKREKNAEAEKEKRKKEQECEDQYTMRFSNAVGKGGPSQPWYTTSGLKTSEEKDGSIATVAGYSGFESKDVWGNEDPRRRERAQARITSNDPLAFMNRAQVQLKKSREDKKRFADARDRELRELRAAEERRQRRGRHGKRKKQPEEDELEGRSLQHRHRHRRTTRSRSRSRSRSRERRHDRKPSHRHDQGHGRNQSRERDHRHRHTERHYRKGEDSDRAHNQKREQSPRRAFSNYD